MQFQPVSLKELPTGVEHFLSADNVNLDFDWSVSKKLVTRLCIYCISITYDFQIVLGRKIQFLHLTINNKTMTKKRMLAIVNSESLVKLIESTELPKSVFPRGIKTKKTKPAIDDQHSQSLPVLQKPIQKTEQSFQMIYREKQDPQKLISHISNMLYTENRSYIDCSFLFYVDPIVEEKVNADLRDFTVKNLQILNKVFFELPIDIFVKSVSLIDRFISRVKVKPKYMTCVAATSFYIAAKSAESEKIICPSLESLTLLSKCGGTVQDLERMMDIILTKLNNNLQLVTAHNFLAFFWKVRGNEKLSSWLKLETLLELSQTSLKICFQRPSVVALACMLVVQEDLNMTFVKAMVVACKIDIKVVMTTAELIAQLYESSYCRQPCSRNSLVWTISKRTLSHMYGAAATSLATIPEDIANQEIENKI